MFAFLFNLAHQLVTLLTIPGAVVAYFQLQNASRSRLATTYLTIAKDWDALVFSRTLITIAPFEDRDISTSKDRAAHLLDVLERRAPFEPGGDIASAENAVLLLNLERSLDTVLSFLEDLGLLCRKSYVGKADVFDIMGSSIVEIVELMLPYIERERQEYDEGETIYANLLWLYERARETTPRQFRMSGYGTPRLFFRQAEDDA